jgi:hypothetical protein
MAKLKLSDWANISEIGASLVIVVSLIYVGLEISQNTVAIQQTSYQSVQEAMQSTELALATNPELLKIVMKAETAPLEVSALEWRRFTHVAFSRIGSWEYLFLARQDSAISEAQWEAFDPFFSTLMCRPGYRVFWQKNHLSFTSYFGNHVDAKLASNCVTE